ncbi:hypothetical protein B1813_15100 [Saccharomonospora piscinae]|uniref:Glycosyltransferase RgtA/B/C/D-like domain-containing protein n=1 Tax=Saccharomonospora piscinae TaxID=687388 RepID=A0A1V9A1B6_SACPI|nr:hypothetical protein [Saccharomonospora piscinae]OQO90850.1 hypothetical protein B1813_15100 [Saccharomonospora piscinae]
MTSVAPGRSWRTVVGVSALVTGLLALFALGTWAAWDFTVDDAYITFRYSEHLAEGHGPVWNVDGDPVEGFTNFGWMVLLAPAAALGWDLALTAAVVSAALGVLVVGMLLRQGHRLGGRLAAVVASLAFVVFLPTYFHVNGGLETVAFAAVVLRATVVGLTALRSEPVRVWEPPALVVLAGLLRPEGVLVAAVPFAVWLWRQRHDRIAWFWTALAGVVGLGYTGWRWWFYGYPLPNTFAVKFGDLDAGWAWVEDTATVVGPLVLLVGLLLLRRTTRAQGALVLGVVAATYIAYAVSGPSMDYLHRYAFHAYPVLCLGAGLAVAAVPAATATAGRTRHRRMVGAATGALAVAWVGLWGVLSEQLPLVANYGVDLRRSHEAIGTALAETAVPPPQRTLAVSDAGAIPYFSDWETIDYLGLNNEAIARGADPTRVVSEQRPTVVVVTAYNPGMPRAAYGLRVTEATAGYEYIGRVRMREGYWQHLFVLPEWAGEVAEAVERRAAEEATDDPGRYESSLQRWFDRLAGRF